MLRSEFFFRTTRELEYLFFLSRKAWFFFLQNSTIGYMTKTLNQIILFSFHLNQNIFFSNNGNQNIFFRKKHNPPPLQVKWSFPYVMSHSWLLFGHCGTEVLLRKIIWSMQDDDNLLWSFVTIKPAAEKILSDGTDVDGTVKYRRARTESWKFITALSLEI